MARRAKRRQRPNGQPPAVRSVRKHPEPNRSTTAKLSTSIRFSPYGQRQLQLYAYGLKLQIGDAVAHAIKQATPVVEIKWMADGSPVPGAPPWIMAHMKPDPELQESAQALMARYQEWIADVAALVEYGAKKRELEKASAPEPEAQRAAG